MTGAKSAQKIMQMSGKDFPKEFYPRPGQELSHDIGSVLNTDSNRRLGGGNLSMQQSSGSSQNYENRDRGRFHDLK